PAGLWNRVRMLNLSSGTVSTNGWWRCRLSVDVIWNCKLGHMITDGTLEELLYLPRFTPGEIEIEGKPFKYHDAASFYHTYCEIFREEIYKFIPVSDKAPIIDCGTNMGLSLLYFSENYPGRKIIAFEPDPDLYRLLLENIEAFNL